MEYKSKLAQSVPLWLLDHFRFYNRRTVFSVKIRSPEPYCHANNGDLLEFYQL